MIPPPNYMYHQGHGGSNYPLNRNGYLYPRHCNIYLIFIKLKKENYV